MPDRLIGESFIHLSVRLHVEKKHRLETLSSRLHISQAEVIRRAIDNYLAKNEAVPWDAPQDGGPEED